MSEIGHNAPPLFDGYSLHIEDLFALISDTVAGGEVATDEQENALDSLLDEVRKAKRDADAARADEKRPHDDAAKAVQAKWKPLVDRCDMAAAEIKRLLTPYRDAKQKAKDEAAKRAREEADARQAAAQEALRTSDDLQERFTAEQDLKAAKKLTAVANKIDRSATGLRSYWEPELTDAAAALRHYREHQPKALKEWLLEQAAKDVRAGARAIPGFNIKEDRRAA